MDTSETYVRMCEKATEMQALFSERVGNYLYMPKDGEVSIVAENHREYRVLVELKSECSFAFDDPYIWLPTQDQLQPLALNDMPIKDIRYLLLVFTDWVGHVEDKTLSMEQLWLAFVMHSLYYKKWNGTDWKLDIEM